MKNKFILALIYIIFFFNSNLLSEGNNKVLKIDDKNVFIVPKDSGFNDEEKLDAAIQDIRSKGIKVIIGPITYAEFDVAKKYNDLIFISPSNINPEFTNNIISVGVSLESQLTALIDFVKKQKKKKNLKNETYK